MREKQKLNKRLSNIHGNNRSEIILKRLSQISQKIKTSHEKETDKNEHEAIRKIKVNPKYFYSYVKSFTKNKKILLAPYQIVMRN